MKDGFKFQGRVHSFKYRPSQYGEGKNERDSIRNCNLLIANDNRSQTRYHCATHPSRTRGI